MRLKEREDRWSSSPSAMFFKGKRDVIFIAVFVFGLAQSPGTGASQLVDCLVAEVNGRPVTLTDLKIVRAFGLVETEPGNKDLDSLSAALERTVNMKVVLDSVRESVPVAKEESEALLIELRTKLGPEEFLKRLESFGLAEEDLGVYLEEKLLYEKIISRRFIRSVVVSLNEIETYYRETYRSSQEKAGLEPRPMMQVLNEVESRIKEEKVKAQVEAWVKSLRNQTDVRIRHDCLKIQEETRI